MSSSVHSQPQCAAITQVTSQLAFHAMSQRNARTFSLGFTHRVSYCLPCLRRCPSGLSPGDSLRLTLARLAGLSDSDRLRHATLRDSDRLCHSTLRYGYGLIHASFRHSDCVSVLKVRKKYISIILHQRPRVSSRWSYAFLSLACFSYSLGLRRAVSRRACLSDSLVARDCH